MGPVGKMAVRLPVTETGSNGRCRQGASVIPAHKGKNWDLARIIAHHFNGIFNGLRSPDVKMHPAFDPEFFLDVLGDPGG